MLAAETVAGFDASVAGFLAAERATFAVVFAPDPLIGDFGFVVGPAPSKAPPTLAGIRTVPTVRPTGDGSRARGDGPFLTLACRLKIFSRTEPGGSVRIIIAQYPSRTRLLKEWRRTST